MSVTFTQIAYLALRDLGDLNPAETAAGSMLADMLLACNNMLDSWKLDRLMVLRQLQSIYALQTNVQEYRIGPGQIGSGTDPVTGNQWNGINAVRPTYIETANIILNNFSPVVRQPLALIDFQRWADIRVQQIPGSIPQALYYDRGFDQISGYGTLNLWPGPLLNYGLELYTWDQTLWNGFVDLITPYIFPPGYVEMIQKQLAVRCRPLVELAGLRISPENWSGLKILAATLKLDMEQYNAPTPLLSCDSAYLGSSQKGAWSYAIGEDRVFGRG